MNQDRLDVCLASPLFYPNFSGAGTRFRRYAPGLCARGVDIRVFTGTPYGSNSLCTNRLRYGTRLPVEYLEDIPIQRVQMPQQVGWRQHMMFVSALVAYCREPTTRPDLIQSLSASPLWLPWWFSFRRLGIPFVITQTMLGELSPKLWKRCLQRIYLPLSYQMADCVVVSSSVARDSVQNIGVANHIEVIPNGLDLSRFQPVTSLKARQALRERLGLDPMGELILFVGAIVERKGVDVLVEAWRSIAQMRPRAYLVLVGPTAREVPQEVNSPGFETRIEATIANSGAADRVIFTGSMKNVEDYYQAADVFVFPSRREGMGNVVLEAFGCGLATVLTPFLGLPHEFGRPDEHYILVERTPTAIAKATVALLESPERRQQLGRQSRRWVEEQMDVEKSLDRYAALYRELTDRFRTGKR